MVYESPLKRLGEAVVRYWRRLGQAPPARRDVDGSAGTPPAGEAAGGSAEQRRRQFWAEFREGQHEAQERSRSRS
jgi:hypothetical protein